MEVPAISSTAFRNRLSLAFEGLVKPLIFLTNWSEAARTSSGVTGGSKLKRVLMFLHICYQSSMPIIYALFRAVFGFLFLCHGLQKLFGLFGGVDGKGATVPLASLAGAAGVLELALGLLVMCGWFTRMAAFLASGEMAVAYFIGHQAQGFWPLQNGGEVAVLYCFAFLYMAAYGSGIWSIDSARK